MSLKTETKYCKKQTRKKRVKLHAKRPIAPRAVSNVNFISHNTNSVVKNRVSRHEELTDPDSAVVLFDEQQLHDSQPLEFRLDHTRRVLSRGEAVLDAVVVHRFELPAREFCAKTCTTCIQATPRSILQPHNITFTDMSKT